MNKAIISLITCLGLACMAQARSWVNLSDYGDDAAALNAAIAAAGDGGVVNISESVTLTSTVVVEDQDLTIIGGKIVKKFSSQKNSQTAGLELRAGTRSCKWLLKNVTFTPGGSYQGGALRVIDERGMAGGSSLEMNGGSFSSSTHAFYEFGLEVDGMASVILSSVNGTGELQYSAGEEPGDLTLSHVRTRGQKTGLLKITGGKLRRVQKAIDIGVDYDTLHVQNGRVQCEYGIYIAPGVVGRRVMVSGNEQAHNPHVFSATELISVRNGRYALQGGGKSVFLTDQTTAAIHMYGNKGAQGFVLDNCKNVCLYENRYGSATIKNGTSNVVSNCNLQDGSKYDYDAVLDFEGVAGPDVTIAKMEVIK